MRVGIVIPHIFMQRAILPDVIFSPGTIALELCDELIDLGVEVTLFTPGSIDTKARNITADTTFFETELTIRGDSYVDLLKKHPLTFITLARQLQSELIATAYKMLQDNELDIVHIYTNEEDMAMPFAQLVNKPIVFTHHDPFNFSVRYKNTFPKYKDLPWISISYSQRKTMPEDTNWVGNVYHGLNPELLTPLKTPTLDYVAYLGRIIEPKGVHLAVAAVQAYNKANHTQLKLKIAGKHYSGVKKDSYWLKTIKPLLDDKSVEYVGYIKTPEEKRAFLGNAKALIIPSTFEEPFGMVMIEALACGTPLIGIDNGAIPEVIQDGKNGFLVHDFKNQRTISELAQSLEKIGKIDRKSCRADFEQRFSSTRMAKEYKTIYETLVIK